MRATGARFAGWKRCPERLLFQHGMSLRVRRSGKHFIQTLKLLPTIGQPLARRKWEAPVDGVTPDLARLPADEVGDHDEVLIRHQL
jgi:triphosphatase